MITTHSAALFFRRRRAKGLALSLAVMASNFSLLCTHSAQAANKAWSNGPADATFSGINWTPGQIPGAPATTLNSGDALFFGTSSLTTLTNDLSSFTFAGLTFNLGASAFTIGGNDFTLSGGITNNSTSLQTINNNITLSGTQTVNANAGNITLGGVISGAGFGITKTGGGTLTLNGSAVNTYTGDTTLNGGTTTLDFANLATPTDLINNGSALKLGGGTLTILGKTGAFATSQTFNGTTVNAAGGQILVTPNGGTSTTVNLGALATTATGGSLLVGKTPGNATTGTITITTTTNKDATGIYGGRVVFSNGTANTGYDWATTASAGPTYTLSAYSGYTGLTLTAGADTSNSLLSHSGASNVTTSLSGSRTTNSLKLENLATAGTQTLALGAFTLTLSNGGLLSTGARAETISGTAGATRLTAGNGSGSYDLIVHQFNSGGLTISAVIGNNGGNAVSLVKAGSQALTLSGANTFTGDVYVNSGTLNASLASALGSPSLATRTITIGSGAVLNLLATNVLGTGANTSATPAIVINGGTLQIGSSTVATQNFNSIGNLTLNGASVLLGSGFNTTAPAAAITAGSTVTVGGAGASTISAIGGATNAAIKLGTNSPAVNSQITFNVADATSNADADLTVNVVLDNAINSAGNGFVVTGLNKTGSGLMVLTAANTYTGPTTITSGTLQIGNGGTTGALSASSGITNNANLTFNRSNTVTQGTNFSTAAITGTGTLTQAGSGVLFLNAQNTYSGGTFLNAGTLEVAVDSTPTSGTVTSGPIGTGTLTINGGILTARSGNRTIANAVTINNDFTLNSSVSAGANTLTLSGNVDLAGGTRVINVTASSGSTISGVISNGGLTKAGNSPLTLSGANTYTGATNVTAGTLSLTGTLGSGAGGGTAITNSATFTQNSTGVITGTSSFTNTAGTAILAGANNYSGATNVNGGTVTFSGTSSIGSLSVADGTTLGVKLTNSGTSVITATDLTLNGSNNFAVDFNGQSNPTAAVVAVAGTLTLNGTTNISLANVNNLGSATDTLALLTYASQTGPGAFVLTSTSAGHTTFSLDDTTTALYLNVNALINTWTGAVSGTWGIATTGSGNWNAPDQVYLDGDKVLFDDSGSNTVITIASTVTPGSVTFSNSTKTYTLSGAGIAGTGGLTLNGTTGTVILTNTNTYTGITTIGATNTLQLGDGTTDGSITNTASITDNGSLVYNRLGSFAYSGAISGSGSLTKNGVGTQTLSGSNNYSGGITLNAGTLLLGHSSALGSGTATLAGGTLGFSANNLTIANAINVTGTTTLGQSANNSATLSGAITGNGTLNNFNAAASANGNNLFFTGDLSGFTGKLDYTDSNSGTTAFWRFGAIGGATIDLSNATVNLNDAGGTTSRLLGFKDAITTANTMKIGALRGDGIFQGSFNGTTGIFNTLEVGNLNTSGTFSGGIGVAASNMDQINLTKVGTGTLTLSGSNAYKGATAITSGTLQLGNVNAVRNSTVSSSVANGLAFSTSIGTFNLGGLSGAGDQGLSDTGNGPVTLSVGGNNASTTYSGILSDGSGVGGALTKVGTGTLTLTGLNTYTGTTTITSGTIQLGDGTTDGSITASANIVDNATLVYNRVGNFTYGGPISGSGAVIKTGAGTQILAGNNSYTGNTLVSTGRLTLSGSNNNGVTATTTVNNGATLQLQANASNTTAGVSSALGTANNKLTLGSANGGTVNVELRSDLGTDVSFAGTSTPNLSGLNPLTFNFDVDRLTAGPGSAMTFATNGGMTIASGTFNITGNTTGNGSSLALGPISSVNNQTVTFNPTTANVSLGNLGGVATNGARTHLWVLDGTSTGNTVTGTISDTLALQVANAGTNISSVTKSNTGTWTLTGTNTYTGVTTITGGTLQIGNGITDGSISASSGITDNSALVFNLVGSGTYANTIGGNGTLAKLGAGTLTLSGPNTYSGGTSLLNGTLRVGADNNLGGAPDTTGALFIDNGATLQTIGSFATTRSINIGNTPGAVQPDQSNPAARIDVGAGTTLTLSGVITGTGTNSRLELLSGASGRTSGGNGLIILDNANGTNNFASIYLHGSSVAGNNLLVKTGAGPQFGNAPVTQDGGSTLISNQNGTFSATFFIGTGGAVRETDSGHTVFRTGPIVNVASQTGGLTFQGDETNGFSAGTLGLGGSNTFVGNVVVNGNSNPGTGVNTATGNATLSIGADVNLGSSSNTLTLNGATLQTGDIIITTGSTNAAIKGDVSLAATRQVFLSGTSTFNVLNTHNSQLNTTAAGTSPTNTSLFAAANLNAAHTNTLTINGVIADVSGTAGTLNKNGQGTLILGNANNSYTGGTMINGGTLSAGADGALGDPNAGAGISINNGAIFNATSTFITNRNINLGTQLPGSVGTSVAFVDAPTDAAATGASALGAAVQPDGNSYSAIISANGGATLTLNGQILGDANSRLMLAYGGGTGNAQINLNNTNGPTWPNPSNVGNRFGSIYFHGASTSDTINNGAAVNNLIVKTASVPQFANASVTQDGGSTLISNQNGTFSASFKIGNGGAVRETDLNHTVFRTGVISNITDVTNAGGLTFQGDETNGFSAGTLGLSGSNTFGGDIGDARQFAVTVNGNSTPGPGNATLSISDDANLGKKGNILNINGGTLAIEDAINQSSGTPVAVQANVTTRRAINITGTATFDVENTHNAQLNSFASTFTAAGLDTPHTNTFAVNGAGTIAGTGSLVKNGVGNMVLGSANSFSGSTTVNAGTLQAASAGALGSTSSVNVNVNSTLLLSGAGNLDRVNDGAGINLNGGTLLKGSGASEGTSSSAGLGLLTLSLDSTIDFGLGGTEKVGTLSFAGFTGGSTLLTINNWLGSYDGGSVGSASADHLIFLGDQSANLARISFTGYSPATEINLGNGFYEITATAVPEPTTIFGALALVGLVGCRERKRIASFLPRLKTRF
jgi:fibronectin-binding autotransporter adhesin